MSAFHIIRLPPLANVSVHRTAADECDLLPNYFGHLFFNISNWQNTYKQQLKLQTNFI